MAPHQLVGLVLLLAAAVNLAVSVPLCLRKVPPNKLYGVRIPKTFASEENWYAINAYGGKQLAYASLPVAITGLVCLACPTEDNEALGPLLGVGVFVVSITVALVRTLSYAKRF